MATSSGGKDKVSDGHGSGHCDVNEKPFRAVVVEEGSAPPL